MTTPVTYFGSDFSIIAAIDAEHYRMRLELHYDAHRDRYLWKSVTGISIVDANSRTIDDALYALEIAYASPRWNLMIAYYANIRADIMRQTRVQSLDELLIVLKNEDPNNDLYAYDFGLAESATDDGIDYTSLPTFGGAEPHYTVGVWSWDASRLLVGESRNTLEIVSRNDWNDQHEITLRGFDAIEYAERHHRQLSKYADPTEGARDNITPEEAREIAQLDPNLIYVR